MNTKPVCQLDEEGYFVGITVADASPLEPGGWLLPAGAVDASPPPFDVETHRAMWNGSEFVIEPLPVPEPEPEPEPPIPLTQRELDEERYRKRASVKDHLMAYMAADNMSRLRDETWTVQQLISLLDDPQVVAAQSYMGTLSFELAAQAISSATTPLLTPEIKADWIAQLTAHFYLEP